MNFVPTPRGGTVLKSLADARLAMDFVSKRNVELLWACTEPPDPILQIMKVVFAVLGQAGESWEELAKLDLAKDAKQFICSIVSFAPTSSDHEKLVALLEPALQKEALYPECLSLFSPTCESLCQWCRAVYTQCGGGITFGNASAETLEATREAAAAFKTPSQPAGKQEAAPKPAALQNSDDERSGGDLLIRSMLSGEVVATLQGTSPDWTWRDINARLLKVMPRQQGAKWQFFHEDQPLGNYATLKSLGIDTQPGAAGELSMVAVSFIDTDKLMSEDEAAEMLQEARQSLNVLTKADCVELKCFQKPPFFVELVIGAICALFEVEESWAQGKNLLCSPDFLSKLVQFDPTSISDDVLISLEWYISHPDFNRETVSRASRACAGLCVWCTAMYNIGLVTAHRNQQAPHE